MPAKLIPRGLTPALWRNGIRSLRGFGNRVRPLVLSVLYLRCGSCEASPKAISRRTSYLWVRLAFHPYPQVIQNVFNRFWFGPPRAVTHASPCPRVAHPVSGLSPATVALFRLGFPAASTFTVLTSLVQARDYAAENNSPVRSTKSTPSLHEWSSDRL